MKNQSRGSVSDSATERVLCHLGPRPRNDDGYFEAMTKVIFRSGLSWTTIEDKWPNFRHGFANFAVRKVARFDEPEIDRLMQDRGIVRNYRKIVATVKNARVLVEIQKECGSFAAYLDGTGRDDEQALCKTLSRRFSFLGGSTVVFFLRCVGEEMPDTLRQWQRAGRRS